MAVVTGTPGRAKDLLPHASFLRAAHDIRAAFHPSTWSGRERRARECPQDRSHGLCYRPVSKVTHHPAMILFKTIPGTTGMTQGCDCQEMGAIEGHLAAWLPQSLSILVSTGLRQKIHFFMWVTGTNV